MKSVGVYGSVKILAIEDFIGRRHANLQSFGVMDW
jgi:hypothetical protein